LCGLLQRSGGEMPRVNVELTEKEVKEIILKTKKSVAEGIKELITQNKDRLSLSKEELQELVNGVVFSHTNNLLSELKELFKVTSKSKSSTIDKKEFERTRSALLKEIDDLRSKLAYLERKFDQTDTDLRVFVAKRLDELKEELPKKELNNLKAELAALYKKLPQLKEELQEEVKKVSYWTVEMMITVGRLKGEVIKLKDRVEALERGVRVCSTSHKKE
jgi:predicted nuclease with TOPRIM domain